MSLTSYRTAPSRVIFVSGVCLCPRWAFVPPGEGALAERSGQGVARVSACVEDTKLSFAGLAATYSPTP